MDRTKIAQGIIPDCDQDRDTYLLTWVQAFLLDRKAQNLSPGSLSYYTKKLKYFTDFAETQAIKQVTQVTPHDLRLYLLHLEQAGHRPGGIHACFRAVRAFFKWFEVEVEPEGWKNPINRVKAPKVPQETLDPVEGDTVRALIGTCDRDTYTGVRDRAIFLFLLDTGARAGELLSLDLGDLDPVSGTVQIRKGKGRKPRTVFLGRTARKVVRAYLKVRRAGTQALFTTDEGDRIGYDGLRAIVTRRSKQAGVRPPSLHSFRRAFAIEMLRNGTNVFTLQALMGHADLAVLRRYLKLVTDDLAQAHRNSGPVDRL